MKQNVKYEECYVVLPSWINHFFYMTEAEKELIKKWCTLTKPKTKKQKKFKKLIKKALKAIKYNYWISTTEPSLNENYEICFRVGAPVFTSHRFCDLIKYAKEFAPEWNSNLANWYELILFYAYRIAKGYWTIEFVCDNSYYPKSSKALCDIEPCGTVKVGGFDDGIGNTYKVTTYNSKIVIVGFPFYENGNKKTVISHYYQDPKSSNFNASGVIVLRDV